MQNTIFINGRFLTKTITGVQRYAFELLSNIDAILCEEGYQNLNLVCLTPPVQFLAPNWKNIEIRKVGINRGNLWEQIDLPFFAGGRLLFSPTNIGPFYYANQVVTFHDASVFGIPEAYSLAFRMKYIFIFKILVRIAKAILTDSQFSQRELSNYLGVSRDRFKVILLGGDHLCETNADQDFLQQCGLAKNSYFLSVASQSPHKNFNSILDVAETLGEDVIFAAAGGSFKNIFRQETYTVPSNVHLLGYVNDNELKALYENALGFIFPSVYEGFGLPILEAMNCGCPVISSHAASLPEVGGDAALYFDPRDKENLSNSIKGFLSNPHLQSDMRVNGLIHAKSFTWKKTAQETLAVLCNYI